jgi:Winged helix DNA-binding domain
MPVKLTWEQALAWRMRRHLLDPIGDMPATDVVRRLCGVQAQVASSAELAIRVRQRTSRPGEVGKALEAGRLIKTWAMRGTLHLLTPEDAGNYLALMASGRTWELPSWQRYFGLTPKHWELFRPAVREALDGNVLTREQLAAAVVATPGLEHVGGELASGWGTLLKPLAWQGDLVFGPSQGNRVTFMSPSAASPQWGGVPEPAEAAPRAILAYLAAYGPATARRFGAWISRGRIGARSLRAWFKELGDQLAEVEVDGEVAYVRVEDVDELASTRPTAVVRLVAGFDQWVLGPGTDDTRIVAAARRRAVSKQSGWIAPTVVAGGVAAGTWEVGEDAVRVTWFRENGRTPKKSLEAEATRLSVILGRDLRLEIATD